MPVMSGFGKLAELPWERVTDKIERRVLAGQQGMIVWWKMKAVPMPLRISILTSRLFGCLTAKWTFALGSMGSRWSREKLR